MVPSEAVFVSKCRTRHTRCAARRRFAVCRCARRCPFCGLQHLSCFEHHHDMPESQVILTRSIVLPQATVYIAHAARYAHMYPSPWRPTSYRPESVACDARGTAARTPASGLGLGICLIVLRQTWDLEILVTSKQPRRLPDHTMYNTTIE